MAPIPDRRLSPSPLWPFRRALKQIGTAGSPRALHPPGAATIGDGAGRVAPLPPSRAGLAQRRGGDRHGPRMGWRPAGAIHHRGTEDTENRIGRQAYRYGPTPSGAPMQILTEERVFPTHSEKDRFEWPLGRVSFAANTTAGEAHREDRHPSLAVLCGLCASVVKLPSRPPPVSLRAPRDIALSPIRGSLRSRLS